MHPPTIFEQIFGGDVHTLRTFCRRVSNILIGIIPVKRWRTAVRNKIDDVIIMLNQSKIEYFLQNYPKTYSEDETIKRVVERGLSIARFGDGEFNMCIGRHKSFQKYDEELVARMKEVLVSCNEKILIGINTLEGHELSPIWKKFVIRRGNRVLRLLNNNRQYDSSTITTNFPSDPAEFKERIEQLKKIWDGRKVVFVVGKDSRFFFEKELFSNILAYEFVYAPAKNAYAEYQRIINDVRYYDKEWLIMSSLGPTATILSYELALEGYQAIDLGQTPSKYRLAKYGHRYPADHPMYNNHQ